MLIKAIATEEIPKNRMIWLGGGTPGEEGYAKNIHIKRAKPGGVPDFVSTRRIAPGEEILVEINDDDIWKVEAADEVYAGTVVTTAEDGKVKFFQIGDDWDVGVSLNYALPGETVYVYRRKHGVNPSWVNKVDDAISG
ncbi:hypothetical protein [Paludifilum halophilum]|uniref:Uncharacterized protein n=1 Tax=Paludifilum halophilum TaxID=1642702 RepID=A0A235B5L1_9BACL|nr:hypothetical protein [Paludifilum halophilum]OYD07588.1 hypothetical protein CHM34_08870 [Paludifilum halophilum]